MGGVALLRRTLNARIGATGLPASFIAKLWASAASVRPSRGASSSRWGRIPSPPRSWCWSPYGLIYFAVTYVLRVEECGAMFGRLARLRR